MRAQKRLGILVLALGASAVLLILFSSFLISNGIRLWFWWQTRGTGVTCRIDSIESPFLRPIVLRGIHLQTTSDAAVRIDASATQATFALNLKGIVFRTRGRTLRTLSIQGLHAQIHRTKAGPPLSESTWNTIQRLLPEIFELQAPDIRVEDVSTVIMVRGLSITGNPIEAGRFEAAEIVILSPLFRQTFTNLKGATDWQSERLTIAGLTLTRGVDVQSLTTDLSHLGKRRVGFDFDVDTFGGKIRASVADEWRSHRSNWNLAGSANGISLTQTAEAFGYTGRIGGLLRAGKFTYRGDVTEAFTGTASLWLELTGPAWMDREADVIMLGASLYGREVELQQLYIKQKKNQLTLNGEGSFPTSAAGWLHPDFRGTVSASIDDLGEFASLFGANREDFTGRVEVEGTVNARDRNVGGTLIASGSGLTMLKSSIDEFRTELRLKKDAIDIAQLRLKRQNDSLEAQGNIVTSPQTIYSGVIDATVQNLNDYLSIFYGDLHSGPVSMTTHADITANVWNGWAVFHLLNSKPATVSATFPLPLGQPLARMWSAPVNLTIDAPDLDLGQLPLSPTAAIFDSGSLSTELTISETFQHPRLNGYVQLVRGRIGFTNLDGRIRFESTQGNVESLYLRPGEKTVSFYGDVDLQDAEHIHARLYPNEALYDLNGPMLNCVNRVEVNPGSLGVPISQIDLRGPIGSREWSMELIGLDLQTAMFHFCPKPGIDNRLLIGLEENQPQPAPTPETKRPRKRKR